MQDLVITNQGQELIAKMIAGTSTASFTKLFLSFLQIDMITAIRLQLLPFSIDKHFFE